MAILIFQKAQQVLGFLEKYLQHLTPGNLIKGYDNKGEKIFDVFW